MKITYTTDRVKHGDWSTQYYIDAFDGNNRIGFLEYILPSSWITPNGLERRLVVTSLHVEPGYRRKGIARGLYLNLIAKHPEVPYISASIVSEEGRQFANSLKRIGLNPINPEEEPEMKNPINFDPRNFSAFKRSMQDLQGTFNDPIIVRKGTESSFTGRESELPKWLVNQIHIERLIEVQKQIPTGTDAEAFAYLMSLAVFEPMSKENRDVYFWLAHKYFRQLGHDLTEHFTIPPYTNGLEKRLNKLKRWIYDEQLKHRERQEKDNPMKRNPTENILDLQARINAMIDQRRRYGMRQEIAAADGYKLYWFNDSGGYWGISRRKDNFIPKGTKLELDANEVFVPGADYGDLETLCRGKGFVTGPWGADYETRNKEGRYLKPLPLWGGSFERLSSPDYTGIEIPPIIKQIRDQGLPLDSKVDEALRRKNEENNPEYKNPKRKKTVTVMRCARCHKAILAEPEEQRLIIWGGKKYHKSCLLLRNPAPLMHEGLSIIDYLTNQTTPDVAWYVLRVVKEHYETGEVGVNVHADHIIQYLNKTGYGNNAILRMLDKLRKSFWDSSGGFLKRNPMSPISYHYICSQVQNSRNIQFVFNNKRVYFYPCEWHVDMKPYTFEQIAFCRDCAALTQMGNLPRFNVIIPKNLFDIRDTTITDMNPVNPDEDWDWDEKWLNEHWNRTPGRLNRRLAAAKRAIARTQSSETPIERILRLDAEAKQQRIKLNKYAWAEIVEIARIFRSWPRIKQDAFALSCKCPHCFSAPVSHEYLIEKAKRWDKYPPELIAQALKNCETCTRKHIIHEDK